MKNFIQIFSVSILLFITLSNLYAQSNPVWHQAHRKINFSSRERQVNDMTHSNFRNNLNQDNKLSNTNFQYSQDLNNRGLKKNNLFYSDNTTWEKLFPYNTPNIDEEGVGVCETSDGNIIMVGNVGYLFCKIIKANVFGDTIWTKKFMLEDTLEVWATGCIGTENGSFVVTGEYEYNSYRHLYLIKLDANGTIIWSRKYNELYTSYFGKYDIQRTADAGFLIYGADFILKTDSLGNKQWNNIFNTLVIDISKPSGNYYYMLGYNQTVPRTYYISKIDINGNLIWQKQIFSPFTDFIRQKIQKLSDKLILWGNKIEYIWPPDIFITTYFIEKADTLGNIYKIDTIPTYRGEVSQIRCFDVLNNNRFIFLSSTKLGIPPHKCVIRIIDSNANVLKSQTITSEQNFGYKIIESISFSQNGYILYCGEGCWDMQGGTSCFYGIRTDTNLLINTVGIAGQETEITNSYNLLQNYPNPFNPVTMIGFSVPKTSRIKIAIYDILGREVKILCNNNFNTGNHKIRLDMTEFVSGIYFYSLFDEGNLISTKKLVLIK